MQALIDFDGWRKWKDFAGSTKDTAAKALPANSTDAAKAKEKKAKRTSRASMDNQAVPRPLQDSDAAAAAAVAIQNGSAIVSEDSPES